MREHQKTYTRFAAKRNVLQRNVARLTFSSRSPLVSEFCSSGRPRHTKDAAFAKELHYCAGPRRDL